MVEAALTHMSELEFRETILGSLPDDFKPLLGPEPKVQPLETPSAAEEEAMVPDGSTQIGHAAADDPASRFGPLLLQKVWGLAPRNDSMSTGSSLIDLFHCILAYQGSLSTAIF